MSSTLASSRSRTARAMRARANQKMIIEMPSVMQSRRKIFFESFFIFVGFSQR
jgi:hypothetical protein